MAEWAGDVTVDEALVRSVVRDQFRSVAAENVVVLGEGWDVTAWLVDRTWVFRFPRRAAVVPGLRRELAVLPHLARLLPCSIPTPMFAGQPSETYAYPYPFLGARHLPGGELAGDAPHDALAAPLAEFLRALHTVDPAAVGADALPIDPMGRGDMSARVPRTLARLDELEVAGLWRAPTSLRNELAAAIRLPLPTAVCVIHGDLHFRQILVDADRLTGIIDWVDICRGDRALDLSIAWSLFSPSGRAAFLAAYGDVTPAQLSRARVLAVFLAAAVALYGHAEHRRALLHAALAGLDRCCG